jgi:glucokinase
MKTDLAKNKTQAIGAVDIGGTKIAAGLVNAEGTILAKAECPTEPQAGYDDALRRITSMLSDCFAACGVEPDGIGIGCTGPVDPLEGRIGNVEFLPGWEGANPGTDLARRFHVSTALENDADCAALGEARWGSGCGRQHIICVTVGTGIGAGMVFGGTLYRGACGAHPELGHHILDASGPQCYCGARGCWEALASGPAIADWFRANTPSSTSPCEPLGAERIFALARDGNLLAREAVAREARYLGLGCANLITMFVPEVLVLSGNVMRSAAQLMDGIHAEIRRNCGLVAWNNTTVALAGLGSDAPLAGAAGAWIARFAENGE